GVMVADRSGTDPPNTIGTPQVVRAGEAPETLACSGSVCRYGDYFGAARDPSDPGIVWVAGEYGTSSGWATFIAAMAETVRFTLSYSVQGGGSGYTSPILTYVSGGQTTNATLTTTPSVYVLDAGTHWSVPSVLVGSTGTERWATNQAVSGAATGSGTVAFGYAHQFSESFAFRVPGSGWYDFGGSVQLTVGAPTGWAVGEWQGAGPGAYSGTQASPTVIVTGSFSETAILYAGLTIVAGGGGSVSYTYTGGAGTIPAGSSHTVYVRPGTNVSLVESPSIAYEFTG